MMHDPLRVLFLEDREDDVILVERELARSGYLLESVRVDTRPAMERELQVRQFDLIISDYSMPQFTALDGLKALRASGHDLPFLIVSGTIGEEIAVYALKGGAHDFIPKNNLRRLAPAVERELREAQSRRERRIAEAELRRTTETLTAAFTASPAPMILLDAEGKVLRWNNAAERVLGWDAAEVIGAPLPFVPVDGSVAFDETMRDLLDGRFVNNEVVRARKNGSKARLLVSAAPIRDASGNVFAAMVILVDITEQRALEEQFRQAQKMEAVGRLAGGIAHDFNNVLTAIEGYTSLLLTALEPADPRREDAQQILHAAERATSFTRQLLAFSRKQVTQPVTIDLNALIADVQKLLERLIGDNITLNVQVSPEPQYVFADKGHIEQVVINLAVNARDAVEGRPGCRIDLRTFRTRLADPECPEMCVIEVEDNGAGIPPEILGQIFEPFFTTKEVGKGTGLGLSTVYGIAQQNNGFVRVRSAAGEGTVFSVFLPCVPPVPELVEAEKRSDAPSAPRLAKILVVEDEDSIRQLVTRVLKREGYDVVAAADPLEALAALDADARINLVLTDVMLPHMSGHELLNRIKSARPDVCIVLMSGYMEEEIDAGVRFIEKPFTPRQLLAKLAEASSGA